MVSAGVPAPVAKLLAETDTVQSAPKPRSSVTWTVPRTPLRVPPGSADPRLATAGATMDSGPAMTATMAVQSGLVLPAGQSLPTAAEATVLDRTALPVSGLCTVTV